MNANSTLSSWSPTTVVSLLGLAALLVGLAVLFSSRLSAADPAGSGAFKNVGVAEFEKLRAEKGVVVLDVRTRKEFEAGHVPGAVNLDVNTANFEQQAAKLDRSKTYLVHCAAGVRSVKACKILSPMKFGNLYNLEGGFKAWEKAGHKPQK